MLQSMLDHNLCAFGVMLTRKRSNPRHVYMLPQEERIDEDTGEQIEAPGLHVYSTVYKDDRRKPPPIQNQQQWFTADYNASTPDNMRDNATAILKKLQRDFNPDDYPNPRAWTPIELS